MNRPNEQGIPSVKIVHRPRGRDAAMGKPRGVRSDVPRASDRRSRTAGSLVVPDQVVMAARLADGVGLIRVSMFPGVLGMDVARDMSRAVADLACDRLIFDLRGNTGGGIGCLRLTSLLCADRRGVGYSVGRAAARKGYAKERVPAFDRIPSSRLGVVPLMIRFATAGRSVAVYRRPLSRQAWLRYSQNRNRPLPKGAWCNAEPRRLKPLPRADLSSWPTVNPADVTCLAPQNSWGAACGAGGFDETHWTVVGCGRRHRHHHRRLLEDGRYEAAVVGTAAGPLRALSGQAGPVRT